MDPSPRWSREGAEARAWRALVVEDDSQVRTTVARYLRHHGFEVSEAGSCAEARFALERRASGQAPPDVLLVDHRLPDGDSLAVLSIVRELAPETPVVVLTGHGTVDLAVRALKLGAVDVLTKPVPMALLLERLGDAVEEGQRGPAWRDDVSSSGTRPVAFVRPAESARRLAKTAPALADGLLAGRAPRSWRSRRRSARCATRTARCSSSARRAAARAWSRGCCTRRARAAHGPSST